MILCSLHSILDNNSFKKNVLFIAININHDTYIMYINRVPILVPHNIIEARYFTIRVGVKLVITNVD